MQIKLQDVKLDYPDSDVAHIQLNRPQVRNALRNRTLEEIAGILVQAEQDNIRCVVISGTEKFFAAGADISELQQLDPTACLSNPRIQYWNTIREFSMPLIAAVNGYALGGGCELAMHCDIIIAGNNASFGQPEIKLGIIPGAGGTQRLIRTIGKSKAMKMVLTGKPISAEQALSSNLISDIVEPEETIPLALKLSKEIAQMPPMALKSAKKSLLDAYELSLQSALEQERQKFAHLTGTKDMQAGIEAFLNKRPARFSGE